ncbi:MAG: hypothetical protein P1U86_18685 [Verrucomicrobiales bacterium]|nr:hypothetical protein [Verrucomicrobiales bacterium]
MALVEPTFLTEAPELLLLYPHYLVSTLLNAGGGRIKGVQLEHDRDRCNWHLEEPGSEGFLIGSQKTWEFRNVLAAFALRFGDHNPYGGSSEFEVDHEGDIFYFHVTMKNMNGYNCELLVSKVAPSSASTPGPYQGDDANPIPL